MAVPSPLVAQLQAFAAAVGTAVPLASQSPLALAALRVQGAAVLTAIDVALLAAAGSLDAPDPTGLPTVLAASLMALATASEDQQTLVLMRGEVGTALVSLNQVQV